VKTIEKGSKNSADAGNAAGQRSKRARNVSEKMAVVDAEAQQEVLSTMNLVEFQAVFRQFWLAWTS